ncbi:MAG: hypothetical protein ACRDLL_03310 [Solirubrobacterales bacterium]
MKPLSADLAERLRADGIDPDLAAALPDVRPINGQSFQIHADQPNGSMAILHWAVGDDFEPWMTDAQPATWWPVGREGSTAIIAPGVRAGLSIASITHRVDKAGAVWRRPLRDVLADAIPVVLPATAPGVPWRLVDDELPTRLVEDLHDAGIDLAFLVIAVVGPTGIDQADAAVATFVDTFHEAATAAGVRPAIVSLAGDMSLANFLVAFQRGPARDIALASVLEYWRQLNLHRPSASGDQ